MIDKLNLVDSLVRFADKVLFNFSSREFQVFGVATYLLMVSILDVKTWLICALGYMGVRTVQKLKEWEKVKA